MAKKRIYSEKELEELLGPSYSSPLKVTVLNKFVGYDEENSKD